MTPASPARAGEGRWPMPGGWLERLGLPPDEIERRSRSAARTACGGRWAGADAELAAAVVYAAGDPGLAGELELGAEPARHGARALAAAAPVLVDVSMVEAGVRWPVSIRRAVAVQAAGAAELAQSSGTTRAAAGVLRCWAAFGAGGVVAVGNAPTALLAVLDLAATCGPPACVIATCPGLHVAAEAKAALGRSGLPHLLVRGTRGGSGLAAAALNVLLSSPGAP